MFYQIIFCCLAVASVFSVEHVYLHSPDLSKENVIGTNVGIRPFRKTGVRIEAEHFRDKLIIHNYGYGGSGLTLAFGGATEVSKILGNNETTTKTVAVLGVGVVGLATAYDLLQQGYDVHLYASEWPPHLTSNVAAGIWTPLFYPKDLPDEKKQWHLRLQNESEYRFLNSVGEAPEFAGIGLIPSYSFKIQAPHESDEATQGEEIIAHFDNGTTKKGRRVYRLGIDGHLFMNDLYSKVKKKGAVLKKRHFESLEDVLSLEEPVIINCMSMGSAKIFNDQEFIPVRGQLVYFKPQANMDYCYYHQVNDNSDESKLFFVSIYPWSDRMILGGVYELNETDPIVTQTVIDRMIKNAEKSLSENL